MRAVPWKKNAVTAPSVLAISGSACHLAGRARLPLGVEARAGRLREARAAWASMLEVLSLSQGLRRVSASAN